jgi:phage terminase Nu1 subunit (DNA packaging protein)
MSNFNKNAVTKVYGKVFTEIDNILESIPKPMQLKLPSLNTIQLPKLQKV